MRTTLRQCYICELHDALVCHMRFLLSMCMGMVCFLSMFPVPAFHSSDFRTSTDMSQKSCVVPPKKNDTK